jgi:hypothetical protein
MASPSLESLPTEIINQMSEYLEDLPDTIRALAQTSRTLYSQTKWFAHRHKTIGFSNINPTGVPQPWFGNKPILRGIRHLTIKWMIWDRWGYQKYVQLLATLIESLHKLDSITWDWEQPIPNVILDCIHAHPGVSLIVTSFARSNPEGDHNDPADVALATSPALTSISLSYGQVETHYDLREYSFRRIVSQAPNLRHVQFKIGWFRLVLHPLGNMNEFRKKMQGFDSLLRPSTTVRFLETNDGLSDFNFHRWARCIKLDTLEHFRCVDRPPTIDFLRSAPSQLPGLKKIHLDLSRIIEREGFAASREALASYFDSCQPLESLSLWGWYGNVSLPDVLDRHGKTLKELALHQLQPYGTSRLVLSTGEVQVIADSCPALKDLTIDLNRSSQKPRVSHHQIIFNALRSMRLKYLQIYVDLGLSLSYNSGIPEPSSSSDLKSYATEMWKHVFPNPRLGQTRDLELKVGEWERTRSPEETDPFFLDEQKGKSRWLIRSNVRDDALGQPIVMVHETGYDKTMPGSFEDEAVEHDA